MNWGGKPFIDYLNAVDELLCSRYGISSNDTDLQDIAKAQEDGWTPKDFVEWHGARYDLDWVDICLWTGRPL